jgi:hypothetical protein
MRTAAEREQKWDVLIFLLILDQIFIMMHKIKHI